jgi:hypothetical protein
MTKITKTHKLGIGLRSNLGNVILPGNIYFIPSRDSLNNGKYVNCRNNNHFFILRV